MVTIQNLEVRFDVEGEGDEAVFAQLFQKHIKSWQRLASEEAARNREQQKDRSLGDRLPGGEGP